MLLLQQLLLGYSVAAAAVVRLCCCCSNCCWDEILWMCMGAFLQLFCLCFRELWVSFTQQFIVFHCCSCLVEILSAIFLTECSVLHVSKRSMITEQNHPQWLYNLLRVACYLHRDNQTIRTLQKYIHIYCVQNASAMSTVGGYNLHKLKHSNWVEDKNIPNKTVKIVTVPIHWWQEISAVIGWGKSQLSECSNQTLKSSSIPPVIGTTYWSELKLMGL